MTPDEDPRIGKEGEVSPGGFRLVHPAVQVFEKKPKPDAAAPPAPEPSPLAGRPRLSLKGRT